MQKHVFGPSLSINWIIEYYGMYEWKAKVQMILSAYAGRSESAHLRMLKGTFSLDMPHLNF